ncbi:hypothetical protein SK128_027574, partial [Halocaridina rubra]
MAKEGELEVVRRTSVPTKGDQQNFDTLNGDLASPVSEVKNSNTMGEEQILHNIYLREKIKDLQCSIEGEMSTLIEKRLISFKDSNLPVAGCFVDSSSKSFTSALTRSHSINKESKIPGQLPRRMFVARPSLLKELLNVNHIESIYNIFVAILVLLFCNKVLEEIIQTG